MIRRRRPSSPPQARLPPLEDDNLLEEILLRLPPQPSSLPRASAVCRRWRRLLSEPRFLRRFTKHHRKPPLLGCFSGGGCRGPVFKPTLDAPNRIRPERFRMPLPLPQTPYLCADWDLVGCRNGLAVITNTTLEEVILWHPLTGSHRRVPYPRWFRGSKASLMHNVAVLCAAASDEDGHVPGECHLHPFKLAFVSCKFTEPMKLWASLYTSESAAWGDMITLLPTSFLCNYVSSVMVGNALCWLLGGGDILEFDLERESLAVIEKPTDAHFDGTLWNWQVLRTQDGGLGLAVLSKSQLSIQLWERKCNIDGVIRWEWHKRIPLHELFPLTVLEDVQKFPFITLPCMRIVCMVGYDEGANVIVLSTYIGDFTLQLDHVQFKQFTQSCASKICASKIKNVYPYSSFYTTGSEFWWSCSLTSALESFYDFAG